MACCKRCSSGVDTSGRSTVLDNQADLSSDTAARQKREADNPKYTKACAKAKRGCIPLGSIIDSLKTANTVTPSN